MPSKTVLIIEDHPGDRDIYGSILWYNGFHVLFAEDGEAGLRLARERQPDLIVLDLELPLLHGLELASRLKQDDSTREIPVVALTGRRLSELGGNAAVLGYARFLEKPVLPMQVLREVEQLIGRSTADQADAPARPEVYRSERSEPRAAALAPTESTADAIAIGRNIIWNIRRILALWEKLAKEEPWFALPPEERIDNLPAIIEAAVHAGLLEPHNQEARRALVLASVEHGAIRREHGLPESAIPIEFHLLRQAIWRHMTEEFAPSDEVYLALRAIDQVITTTLNASMWGYFREEIEAQGLWQTALDRLISEHSGHREHTPADGSST